MDKKAFTLVELLVVVAVLGLLASIVFSNLREVKGSARISNIMQFEASTHRLLGADIIGWWKLDGNAEDVSGYNNHGSLFNVEWVDGRMGQGQAGSFSNSYINIGTGDDYFPLHIFSIGVWIKTPGLGQEMSMNGIVSITYGLTVYLTSSGNLAFRMDDGSSIPSITVIKSLHDDEWHHILVSFDGIDRRMYIDGELMRVTEFVGWTGSTRWPTNYARIGCENNNCSIYKFNGLIDDIRIYSRALTTSEIQTLYAQTKDKYLADMD